MKRYYLMGAKKGKASVLNVPIFIENDLYVDNEFADITFIDGLFTLNYNSEEIINLLKKYNPAFFRNSIDNDTDFFIARVSLNERKKTFKISFYEIISKDYNLRIAPKILHNLQIEALKRMECVKNSKYIALSLDNELKKLIELLITNTSQTPSIKKFMLRKESVVDQEIKKNLQNYYSIKDDLIYQKIAKKMCSYKNLRGYCIEFLQHNAIYPVNIKEKNINREHYLFPSGLFGYIHNFPLTLDEIGFTPKSYIPPVSEEEDTATLEVKMLDWAYKRQFSNPIMQHFYELYGINGIFENMAANDIYGFLTDEDQLKLGLINEQEYIAKNKQKYIIHLNELKETEKRSSRKH